MAEEIGKSEIQAAHSQNREPGSGQWLLEGDLFDDWLTGRVPLIWLNGDDSCGKTVLCSSIIDKLQNSIGHSSSEVQCVLAYFCFSWDSRESCNLGVILRSILA